MDEQAARREIPGMEALDSTTPEELDVADEADEADVESLLSSGITADSGIGLGLDTAPSPTTSSPPSQSTRFSSSTENTEVTSVTIPSPTVTPLQLTPTSQAPQLTPVSAPDATPRYPIPNRRPTGWISSLGLGSRTLSDASGNGHFETIRANSLGKGKGASRPRVTSVHAQPPQGRRVSGTMQYAIAPPPTRTFSTGSDFSITDNPFNLAEAESASLPTPLPEQREEDGEEGVEEEEERIRFQVATQQEQDEVWMAYVRQQLGALFPDFFHADPSSLTGGAFVEDDDGEDEKVVEREPFSPSLGDTSFTETSTTESSALATPPPTGRPSLGALERAGLSVPNVREEITGLRDEIMRLRSVVGGLAEGLRNDAVAYDEEKAEDEAVDEHTPTEGDDTVEIKDIPDSFMETAPTSVSIIRLLDQLVCPLPHKEKDDRDIFEPTNLEHILEYVRELSDNAASRNEGSV
nr:hypothetical protein L203_04028 [Cryptococcus depauperatus CBS 7841]